MLMEVDGAEAGFCGLTIFNFLSFRAGMPGIIFFIVFCVFIWYGRQTVEMIGETVQNYEFRLNV